ncbi:MAG TPA: hypothetical protein VFT99_17035, partial [Roseiflexaceae bacterium]|nr:hypothetical protein [Roseiflexaceae bacterium]
ALYPFSASDHLTAMNSIVTRNIPLGEKLSLFWKEYLTGLSPFYWFAPDNGIDLERHTMKGWGNLPRVFLPFVLVGLWTCVRQWRSAAHRAVLIAILAAPFAAALVFIHNYRVLAMVVPAAILTGLGIERIGAWLAGFVRAVPVALGTAVLLVAMNSLLLYDALANGPTWYRDYGLFGMQYGASQVFPLIAEELETEPQTEVLVSHSWANFPDAFIPFFVPENQRGRVATTTINDYLSERREIRPNQLFVLSAQEYDAGVASGKLQFDTPRRIVPYPDGRPGFYFVQFRYVPEIDAMLEQERAARRELVDDTVELDGQQVRVRHSKTDLGSPADLFDGNLETPLRGVDSNPFVLEFAFDTPRSLRAIELHPWPMTLDLTVIVTPGDGGPPRSYTRHYPNLARDSLVEFALPDGPLDVSAVRLELRDSVAGEIAKV